REAGWRRVGNATGQGLHTSAVYDTRQRVVVVLGDHRLTNEVIVYDPATRRDRVMPTPGRRPPPFQHAPTAWDESRGVVVALVDDEADAGRPARAGTWLYETRGDTWTRLPDGDVPFRIGM